MKLLHVKQARAVWLFDVNDLNPRGHDFVEGAVQFIKDRYSFNSAPNYSEVVSRAGTANATGLEFKRGRFQARNGASIEIISLNVHSDGIVVDTLSSTQESERVAADLLESTSATFGLAYEPSIIRGRLYVSNLVVGFDVDLADIHPGLRSFADSISETLAATEPKKPFRLAGLQFWTEPNDSGTHRSFVIVPQAGRLASERRYFSEAPLRTEDHLRLLESFEQMVSRKAPRA